MAKYLARSCPRCNGYLGIVLREQGRNTPVQAINGQCLECGYRLAWILVQGRQLACRSALVVHHRMAKKAPAKIPPGPQLDILTAQKVFGWKNVHEHENTLVGKKADKLGRWRSAKVPSYSTNPVHAYAIDERMKQLGRSERYAKELSRLTRANSIPADWATPEQRAKAAPESSGKIASPLLPATKSVLPCSQTVTRPYFRFVRNLIFTGFALWHTIGLRGRGHD